MNCIKFLFSVLLVGFFACSASAKTDLIPLPQKVTWGKGNYVMKKSVTIAYVDPQLKPAAAYLAQNLTAQSGVSCKVASYPEGWKKERRLSVDYRSLWNSCFGQ